MEFAEVVPVLGGRRLPGRPARRPAGRPPARGPAAVPGRRAHRRARGDAGRRADPRGRAGGRARRAAALDRGGGRGDVPARGAADDPAGRARDHLRRAGRARRGSSSARAASGCAQVGTDARRQIEALLGTPVFLDLHVKVAKDWQRDPSQLRKLGFLAGAEGPTRTVPPASTAVRSRRRTMVSTSEDTTEKSRPREGRP